MRYRVELLAVIAFSSSCPCGGTEERTSHPREEAARAPGSDANNQPKFPPNPPKVTAIQRWGKSWIATTSTYKYSNDPSVPRERWHFYVLDLRNLGVAELVIPAMRRVLAVTPGPTGEPLALASASSGIRLVGKRDGAWQSVDIPVELAAAEADRFLMTASKERLVVLNDHEVWTRTNQQWEHVPLRLPEPREGTQSAGIPDHVLLDGPRLYMGFDRGEFGGGVLALNLETRALEIGEGPGADSRPVHGFAKSPDGSVWVVEGLAHLSLAEGAVRELRNGRPIVRASKEGRINWKRSATAFSGLAFDSSQRPHILTSDYGVLRRQNGSWKQLTRSRPGDSYAGGLVFADDHTALVWLSGGRIRVWNLRTDEATRIVLPRKSW